LQSTKSKVNDPLDLNFGDALVDADALGVALADADDDALGEALADADDDALGEALADADDDALDEAEAEGDGLVAVITIVALSAFNLLADPLDGKEIFLVMVAVIPIFLS
jgi:hypothetical protein